MITVCGVRSVFSARAGRGSSGGGDETCSDDTPAPGEATPTPVSSDVAHDVAGDDAEAAGFMRASRRRSLRAAASGGGRGCGGDDMFSSSERTIVMYRWPDGNSSLCIGSGVTNERVESNLGFGRKRKSFLAGFLPPLFLEG